jgi:hypothetical protein
MLMSSILVQNVYDDLGLDYAVKIIDSIESGLSNFSLLLYFPRPEIIIEHCIRIKEDLIHQNTKREFYYWDKLPGKLQELHDMLRDRGFIVENKNFLLSFKKESVPIHLRTIWIGNGRELIFLTFYLFRGLFHNSFYKCTNKLFKMRRVNYSEEFLRQTYYHIREELDHQDQSSRKRGKLLTILEKIGIQVDN